MARKRSRYSAGQTSDRPPYSGEGPTPRGTKPLLPVRVPDLDPSHVIKALKGTGGDYSSDKIRSSIRQMVDAGTIDQKQAGHLAMLAVYAGDRIEGIGSGQAVLGGVKPGDERYFEGSPGELAAMRRKRTGTRKEIAESVPAEYRPILKRVFDTEEGRRMVSDALRSRFKKGLIPTGEGTERRIEEAVRNIGYAPARTRLGAEPAGEKPVGPTLSRQEQANRSRAESRALSAAGTVPAPTTVRKGAKLKSLGPRAAETLRKQSRRQQAFKPSRSEAAIAAEQRRKDIEEKGDVEFPYRSRRTPPAVKDVMSIVPGTRSGVRTLAGSSTSDMPIPRRLPRVRTRGQALEGRVPAKVIRPTREGVLERIAARQEQLMSDPEPVPQSKVLRALARLANIRKAQGRAYDAPIGPAVPTQVSERYGPAGIVRDVEKVLPPVRVPTRRVVSGSRVVMRKARRKVR